MHIGLTVMCIIMGTCQVMANVGLFTAGIINWPRLMIRNRVLATPICILSKTKSYLRQLVLTEYILSTASS